MVARKQIYAANNVLSILVLAVNFAVLCQQVGAQIKIPDECPMPAIVEQDMIFPQGNCSSNVHCDQSSCPCEPVVDPNDSTKISYQRKLCMGCAGPTGNQSCVPEPICNGADSAFGSCPSGFQCGVTEPDYENRKYWFFCQPVCGPGKYRKYTCPWATTSEEDRENKYVSYPCGEQSKEMPPICAKKEQTFSTDESVCLKNQDLSVWGGTERLVALNGNSTTYKTLKNSAWVSNCPSLTDRANINPQICFEQLGCGLPDEVELIGQKCEFPSNCPSGACESVPNQLPYTDSDECKFPFCNTYKDDDKVCKALCVQNAPKVATAAIECEKCPKGHYKPGAGNFEALCLPCPPDFESSTDGTYCCHKDYPGCKNGECRYSSYSEFGECIKIDGQPTKKRTRTVLTPNQYSRYPDEHLTFECDDLKDSENCGLSDLQWILIYSGCGVVGLAGLVALSWFGVVKIKESREEKKTKALREPLIAKEDV